MSRLLGIHSGKKRAEVIRRWLVRIGRVPVLNPTAISQSPGIGFLGQARKCMGQLEVDCNVATINDCSGGDSDIGVNEVPSYCEIWDSRI